MQGAKVGGARLVGVGVTVGLHQRRHRDGVTADHRDHVAENGETGDHGDRFGAVRRTRPHRQERGAGQKALQQHAASHVHGHRPAYVMLYYNIS